MNEALLYKIIKALLQKGYKTPQEIYDRIILIKKIPEKTKPGLVEIQKIFTLMRGIRFKCPFCMFEQDYSYRGGKRLHTYCNNSKCKKHLEIKKIYFDLLVEQKKAKDQIIKDPDLSKTDLKILQVLHNATIPLTQSLIAQKTNKSRSTISRRIKILLSLGKIMENPLKISNHKFVKQYCKVSSKQIAPNKKQDLDKKQDQPKKVKFPGIHQSISIHNIRVGFKIIGGKLDTFFFKTSKMNNWVWKYFKENDLIFRKTNRSIFCNPFGIGGNGDQALENVIEKAFQIKEYTEKKFNIHLSNPELFLQYGDGDPRGVHYIPLHCSIKDYQSLTKAWTDKSHPLSFETSSKNLAERVLSLFDEIDKLKEQKDEQPKNTLTKEDIKGMIQNEFNKFTNDFIPLFVKALKESFSNTNSSPQIGEQDSSHEPKLDYI